MEAKATYSKANGLFGSTLGIVGLGSIGLAIGQASGAGFGMRICCLDRRGAARPPSTGWPNSTWCATARSPLLAPPYGEPARTDRRRNLQPGGRRLPPATMKPGAILVDTSRGGVVDEAALLAALDARPRPAPASTCSPTSRAQAPPSGTPLTRHPRVVATHHIGASTARGPGRRRRGGHWRSSTRSRPARERNCVNLAPRGRAAPRSTDTSPRQRSACWPGSLELLRGPGSTSSTCRTGSSQAARLLSPRWTGRDRAHRPARAPRGDPEVLGSSLVALDSRRPRVDRQGFDRNGVHVTRPPPATEVTRAGPAGAEGGPTPSSYARSPAPQLVRAEARRRGGVGDHVGEPRSPRDRRRVLSIPFDNLFNLSNT
ncbi:hypothetical protein HBB16_20170 [Pseudonocardia sp. MCCB 268]|nr:hypothetical protein [Pseudonocardia cytotoxica]